ncbi:MAG: hypothetical protein FWE66_05000 [Oscillospiraceae bacterium]|nr:hypothetical protein [Oscillospiraceae bacterium]
MAKRRFFLSEKQFFFLLSATALVRLLFTFFQRATLMPEISMLDDFLVYESARSISAGRWLGAYGFMTIGKHMLFSVWLAFLIALGVPFLLAGQAFYTAASATLVLAFTTAVKNRVYQLCFFIILVFNPASYADFTLRAYRDNITVSVAMFVFASVIGFAFRADAVKTAPLWIYGILGGASLGASFLLREDGVWLLPFVIVGIFVSVLCVIGGKRSGKIQRLLALSMLGVFAACSIGAYCLMNYVHYGRFIISDMTSKEFYDACGAMTRVIVSEEDFNPIVTLPYSSRKKLYEHCPTFAELEQYIESEYFHRMKKDMGDGFEDISGGGYYWAVRNAASLSGHYSDTATAKEFYRKLADEINAACDSGLIEATGPRSAINAPITAARIGPTMKETLNEIVYVLFYRDIKCSPDPSVGSRLAISKMEDYLNTDAFVLRQEFNDNYLVILTVYSKNGPVGAQVTDSDSKPVDCFISNATGSDIYVEQLLGLCGDTLFTDNLRRYIRAPFSLDGYFIELSVGDVNNTVPIAPTDGMVDAKSMKYSIEYIGADYEEASDADYRFFEIWGYRAMRVVTALYRVIMPALFVAGFSLFVLSATKLTSRRKEKTPDQTRVVSFWVTAGLILIALFRLVMVAFIEVTAFGIGTFPMYFAAAYPLFIAFSFSGFFTFLLYSPNNRIISPRRADKRSTILFDE